VSISNLIKCISNGFIIVTNFGIALPKWIVEGKNSYLVLAAYVIVFMVIMPIIVVSYLGKLLK